ncbi:uncharacterized protein GGS22DRAFT_121994 [Annulohypoxylon maeteangense]|uniref:uncharacterized protein n=1 Tax=Annulohypoxylon maeteangense TaxID=1927788 RepID=UPI002007BF38|nr:uncharacterized protein GGS22DRAFT_121994 [Annulohypoxylon maeteangense]KAI0885957.1 hypothetical protein GGS22DRAFT_121994 [Annulohypoxylon maeteangense]
MDSIFLSSVSLGILVEKEIVVRIEDKTNGDSAPSLPSSVVSVVRSISNLTKETKISELRETTSSLPSGKMLARPNAGEDCRKDLVEFLQGPPPPGNRMSIPDNASISSTDTKWGVFKVFRKKRKRRKRRQPPLIKLPDSAVSARTIDGHRYIAISIPINYSTFSPVPLQYPTVSNPSRKSTSDPRRNTLKTVTEDHESLSSISLATKSATQQEGVTELAPPPRKVSLLSTVPSQASQEEITSKKGKELDTWGKAENIIARQALMTPLISNKTSYITDQESKSPTRDRALQQEHQKKASESIGPELGKVPRVIEITPKKLKKPPPATESITHEDHETPKNDSKDASKSTKPRRFLLTSSLSAPVLPVRTSSRRAPLTFSGRSDIDNVASRRPMLLTANSDNGDGNGRGTGPCGSVTESLRTTESSPRLFKAQTATAYQSVPIVVRPPSHPDAESPLNLNFPTPPSNNSIRANSSDHVEILSPPAVAKVVSSRKDRVRERKQKDIEKLKAQLRQTKAPTSGVVVDDDWPESPVLGRFGHNIGPLSSKPYLTAKLSDIGPIRSVMHLKSPYLSPEAAIKKRRQRSASVPAMTSSSSPSPIASPMPWEGSTAYYRRREKQAEREENEARVRREKYAAQRLAEEAELQDKIAHQKLLRRYEKLKESRTRDMEKRLHRLERNGEVLMQSMVSLMDTLNRLLQDQHQNPLQRSATVRNTTTSASRPRRKHTEIGRGRAQSLRSIRSYDNLREILRTGLERGTTQLQKQNSPNPRQAERERDTQERKENDATGTRVSKSALEALQEHLQSQTRQIAQGSGHSSDSSNDQSIDADSVEVMEPLMRELQATARQPEVEGGKTSGSEPEIFNLF